MVKINAQETAKLENDNLFFGPSGLRFRNRVHSILNLENERDLVVIDLSDTNSIDSSFCREGFIYLINELAEALYHPQVLFVNVSENVKQNLEVSFTFHKKYCLIKNKQDTFEIVGKCPEPFVDTIKTMITLREAKVRDVARLLQIEALNTVNNRLKALYNLCIINRKEVGQESGGKEFVYYLRD